MYTPHQQRQSRQNREPKPPGRDWFDRLTLGTAIVGVVVITVSTVITAYQAWIMRNELSQMISQQRAWLSLETRPLLGIIVHQNGAEIAVRPGVTNHGGVPALMVRATARLFAVPANGDGAITSPYGELRACGNPSNLPFGVTVFPSQTVELEVAIPAVTREEIDAVMDADGLISFVLTTCVEYRTGRLPHHQTGNWYLIERADRAERYTFVAAGDVAQIEEISLSRFGAGEEAN